MKKREEKNKMCNVTSTSTQQVSDKTVQFWSRLKLYILGAKEAFQARVNQ